MTILSHPAGTVRIEELPGDRRRLHVEMADPGAFVAGRTWDTAYPVDLVRHVLDVKGPAWVCDELRRDEDPSYVEAALRVALHGVMAPADLDGARILDFGCGSGASTSVLGRLHPGAAVIGVDLDPALLGLARRRAAHHGLGHVELHASPDGSSLPDGLGDFDVVLCSAVFEHLLPDERRRVLPLLWRHLRPSGLLFLNQTPHRWSPVEAHTTGLPLLNYLPRPLALRAARRWSPRVAADESWASLLRRGIRGGTEREVLRVLRAAGDGTPVVVRPRREGHRREADLWLAASGGANPPRAKRLARHAFAAISVIARQQFSPMLTLAVRRD